MKPARIKRLIKKLYINPSARMYQRTLGDALKAHAESRKTKPAEIHPRLSSTIITSRVTKLATAAVITIVIGVLVIHTHPRRQTAAPTIPAAAKSPGEMMTAMSLKIAYRRGGIEAVDRQCKEAIKMLGPRPAELTVEKMLTEFNGT